MKYSKTILSQLLSLFKRLEFEKYVKQYNGNHRIRTLSCWDQFIYILFAQLSKQSSLRDIVDSMNSHQKKLYHFGAHPVCRSTLSDANNNRDYRIYRDLFFFLLQRVQKVAPKYKLKISRKLFIMDSTTIDLCLKLFPWARFRKTKSAIRIHTLFQADGFLPVFLNMTDGQVHDTQAARTMDVPKGSFLTYDRGYTDYKQYKVYTNNDVRFVTRLKNNAQTRVVQQLKTHSPHVISDELVLFTGFYASRDYPHKIRKISYCDPETGKNLVFLTNDLNLDAQTVADIYKARWEIELFFKTIKQNLKIKRFFGNSQNAVWTQVWIAMIAYLLVTFQKYSQRTAYSVQKLFKLIQVNLFERKSLYALVKGQHDKPPDIVSINQLVLFPI